ncbi:hypothetical protein ACP6PL_23775 [Dapis sp. BLCC M126]|uniref:hypothetical protein n=1 Tax=Dapis sp. BLCC M126 TaxID=3400189 RepID=UPI003CF0BA3F
MSNARCLSEGVDVSALDAVIFLTPRNSMVNNDEDYRVEKMTFGRNKNGIDKTTIIYNSKLT